MRKAGAGFHRKMLWREALESWHPARPKAEAIERSFAQDREAHGNRAEARARRHTTGLETRSDDTARLGTVSGTPHESDDRRTGGRSPFPGLPPARDRRPDLGCCWPRQVAASGGSNSPARASLEGSEKP